jgi:hypothetical protein
MPSTSWWLKKGHEKARCHGTRKDDGKRCKNFGRVDGLCGIHAQMQGGKAASDPAGWSRKRLMAEYLKLLEEA